MSRRILASVVAVCALVTACSSSDPTEPTTGPATDATSENYVGFDDESAAPTTAPPENTNSTNNPDPADRNESPANRGGESAPLAEDELARMQAELDSFVAARDLIVVGDAELVTISAVVSRNVRSQVDAERTLNLANIEDYDRDARYTYDSTATILSAGRDGALYRAEVCIDRRGSRFNGNIDGLALRQDFLFDAAGDSWILREIDTDHDGEYGTPGLTCVPPVIAEAATDATEALLLQIEAVLADPSSLSSTDFSQYASGNAEHSATTSMQTLPPDQRRVTPTEFSFTPIGIYPDLTSFHVSMSACRYFPEGAINQVGDTDNRVPALAGVVEGTSVEDQFIVFVDVTAEDGSVTAKVVDLETAVSLGCWQG